LLAAIPTIGDGASSIFDQPGRLIEGELPSPTNLPRGCRFASRCPQRMARCREVEPALAPAAANHLVACHLYGNEHGADPASLRPPTGKADTALRHKGGSA
jgi:oligopeptide/dipeptide ABC transporter ATP-binding protein